jgi:sugar lactone lactonase YvrE
MTRWTAEPATVDSYQLAEGPVWDGARRRLLWVDIVNGAVLTGTLDGRRIQTTSRLDFGCMVSAVTVAADGRLLVAAHDRLLTVEVDGTRTDGPVIVADSRAARLNDGKTDSAGRFLVGTMALDSDAVGQRLVSVDGSGAVTTVDDDLTLSNGLAWSVDGRRLYNSDTVAGVVYVRDYDSGTGRTGERRVHLRVDDGGMPDGICMDSADHLWVAVWGGGEVRRFSPDGELTGRVEVAAPHSSSVAFAGEGLDVMVVTTARDDLTDDQLRAFPDSGRLFTVPVDVPGAVVAPWVGSV